MAESQSAQDAFGFRGVHVVITGASGGIGLATVKLFHSLGAFISAQGNTSMEALENLKLDRLFCAKADVTSEVEVDAFYWKAMKRWGRHPEALVGRAFMNSS
jgi:NAD(P)-dependent dehydrogenase (short-subunit alcohol dehydrogenase family)